MERLVPCRSQDFVWENENELQNLTMKSFRFRIGVSALNGPSDLVIEARAVRLIAAKYPDMEIYTYEYSRMIADQVHLIEKCLVEVKYRNHGYLQKRHFASIILLRLHKSEKALKSVTVLHRALYTATF